MNKYDIKLLIRKVLSFARNLIPKRIYQSVISSNYAGGAFFHLSFWLSNRGKELPTATNSARALYLTNLQKDLLNNNNSNYKKLHFELVVLYYSSDIKALETTLLSISQQSCPFNKIHLVCPINSLNPQIFRRVSSLANVPIIMVHEINKLSPLSGYLVLVNVGDILDDSFTLAFNAKKNCEFDLGYSDYNLVDYSKPHKTPLFLPDWSPDLQLSSGYIFTGLVVKADAFTHLSMPEFSRSWIQDVVISYYMQAASHKVLHIPMILLETLGQQEYTSDYLVKQLHSTNVKIVKEELGVRSLYWPIPNSVFLSIIIPTRNSKDLVEACINSIIETQDSINYEIILVDNNSDDKDSLIYFDELNEKGIIKLIKYPGEFNYSAINNFAVTKCSGNVLCFLNNDIEILTKNWKSIAVGHVMRGDIGCVGVKLLYPDKRIQHAGVILGYGGGAGHAHKYFDNESLGYTKRIAATGNFSAVTAACLFVQKEDFDSVGGFDCQNLKVAFSDVDLCLKIAGKRKRNLYCAEVVMYHFESATRGADVSEVKRKRFQAELDFLKTKWESTIDCDPYYNINLTRNVENFAPKSSYENISVFSRFD
jgi:GT2 family glycosyltransferase